MRPHQPSKKKKKKKKHRENIVMLNDASDWERCCWVRGRPVFVRRELGASKVVKRLLSVHHCGGQAGLWAVLAELEWSVFFRRP